MVSNTAARNEAREGLSQAPKAETKIVLRPTPDNTAFE